MSSKTAQEIPPKMAQQLADRARAGEGIRVGNSDMYQFVVGNLVSTVMINMNPPMGTIVRDPREADRLRAKAASNDGRKPAA
ncbi:MAG: hypothetical protein CL535_16180 [Ahrensia sp.]|nr:hypothetical protein [Ahrensia sp.]|tara:strand:+ start:98119 stop:98364 length:246 start_codon:yes stop_codon:yes gene_type:complete